jgi:hypothetical protein
MRLFSSALILAMLSGACASGAAQQPAVAPQAAAARVQPAPSVMMQPALDLLNQAIGTLRPDKWKASDAVRDDAAANISSIRRDLDATLPQLLATADGAPASVTQMLPAYRNIEALYDVLLRVAEAGRLSAPGDQRSALESARDKLESARRALGDRIQAAALAREQQVHNLQATLRAIPPAPAPAVCPTPAPEKKRRVRRKTTKKPVPATAQPQSGAHAMH